MDTDILKPNTGYLSVERPSQIPSSKGSSEPPTSPGVITPEDERSTPYIEPVSEDEGDEEINVEPAKDEGKRTRLTGDEFAQAVAYREKMLKEREAAGPMPPTRRKNGNAARDRHNPAGERAHQHPRRRQHPIGPQHEHFRPAKCLLDAHRLGADEPHSLRQPVSPADVL